MLNQRDRLYTKQNYFANNVIANLFIMVYNNRNCNGRVNMAEKTILEKYQTKLKLSSYELCKETGLPQNSLRKFKQRKIDPSLRSFYKLCLYFEKQEEIKFDMRLFLEDFF